jgi:endonuclease G
MKKLLYIMLLPIIAHAQDTVRIKHTNYTTLFDTVKHYPVLVEWVDTHNKILCKTPVKRADDFAPDPKLSKQSDLADDYKGTGFDRGHLAPAGDNGCLGKDVMSESFFYTNMAPQYPGLNRGLWKELEDMTRTLAIKNDSVFVKAGCAGTGQHIKHLYVPTMCWKIITVKKTKQISAYIFPNVPEKGTSLDKRKVSVDSIEKLTKLKLK